MFSPRVDGEHPCCAYEEEDAAPAVAEREKGRLEPALGAVREFEDHGACHRPGGFVIMIDGGERFREGLRFE